MEETEAKKRMFGHLTEATKYINSLDKERFEEELDLAGDAIAVYERDAGYLSAEKMIVLEKSKLSKLYERYREKMEERFEKRTKKQKPYLDNARSAAIKGDIKEMVRMLYSAQEHGMIPVEILDDIKKYSEKDIDDLEEDKKQKVKASLDALLISSI